MCEELKAKNSERVPDLRSEYIYSETFNYPFHLSIKAFREFNFRTNRYRALA